MPATSPMAVPLHFPPQRIGTEVEYEIEFHRPDGSDAPYTGFESLAFTIFPIQGGDPIASPTLSWTDPARGIASVAIFADPNLFRPIVYRASATVLVAGRYEPGLPEDSFVTFTRSGDEEDGYHPVRVVRSGIASYCTVAQFLRHVDRDYAGQLVRDDGGLDTPEELDFDTVVSEALQAASGEVESACARGRLYSASDLAAMAASGSNGAAFLRSLVADLACVRLRMRRAFVGEMMPQERRALELLDALSRGQRIFPFAETIDAGLPKNRFQSRHERDQIPFVADDSRFWGSRARAHRPLF